MPIASRPIALVAAAGIGLAMALTGCGAATTSAAPGDGVVAVSNTSDQVVYLQFEAEDGSTITYRVDPGAVGRAEATDPATAPVAMRVVTAECRLLSQQSDPAFGQIVVEGRGSISSTAADDPEVASRPLLPTEDACP